MLSLNHVSIRLHWDLPTGSTTQILAATPALSPPPRHSSTQPIRARVVIRLTNERGRRFPKRRRVTVFDRLADNKIPAQNWFLSSSQLGHNCWRSPALCSLSSHLLLLTRDLHFSLRLPDRLIGWRGDPVTGGWAVIG